MLWKRIQYSDTDLEIMTFSEFSDYSHEHEQQEFEDFKLKCHGEMILKWERRQAVLSNFFEEFNNDN